jgi:hypothetical protein
MLHRLSTYIILIKNSNEKDGKIKMKFFLKDVIILVLYYLEFESIHYLKFKIIYYFWVL